MRTFLLSILLALATPLSTYACSEPSAPSCATRYGSFDDEWEFDRCKDEMESYKSEVEDYMTCRNREAQEAIDDANRDNRQAESDYSDAVDSFNRRARSN
ncbi:hypothetical protein [Shinella fusca]|uniref:Uncharacterized protein n=1 Tax=Shinella fusca TaxID=544480 RepID=A0A7W8DUH7_9HYPH|nr:hypothetical protein [Shinella fusca]MBB5041946.1 hypothetical protein [Shinella fusca]